MRVAPITPRIPVPQGVKDARYLTGAKGTVNRATLPVPFSTT